MRFPFAKHVALPLVLVMGLLSLAPRVEAGLAPSKPPVAAQAERAADLDKIQAVLENKLVQERLAQLGYGREEIQAKLQGLSSEQIHQLAANIDQLAVGGLDAWGFIVGVGLLVLIIVAVLYFSNREVVVRQR